MLRAYIFITPFLYTLCNMALMNEQKQLIRLQKTTGRTLF